MPLFEIHCCDCNKTSEVLLRRPDESAICPECGGARVERLLSVPAAPSVSVGQSLPMARGGDCGAPRCCGGGCPM